MKQMRILSASLGLALLVGHPGIAQTLPDGNVPALQYFPLIRGNVWTYQGVVAWTDNSGKVRQERLTFQMKVTDVYRRGPMWLAVLQGHPVDSAWYEKGKPPSHSAYLCIGYQIYELDTQRTTEVIRRLQDPRDSLINLISEEELAFDLPLLPGKRFGSTSQVARDDGRYQWAVLTQPQGASSDESELLNDTLPAHIRLRFKPGIGITSYEYVHHGTTAESYLTLVGFTPGQVRNR